MLTEIQLSVISYQLSVKNGVWGVGCSEWCAIVLPPLPQLGDSPSALFPDSRLPTPAS
ncbi:hypothetical protein [Scytonema millei]|uniref:Uncharacterized protein n=1 Tax=Scytonema millei VB511283 TaxID=1245923 RepID=A0A9X5E7R5_9CYAN|nr:hypothetical protein [Scytonema millei]NHC36866.1 hypothetical protein [Scytonema millei VB511283]